MSNDVSSILNHYQHRRERLIDMLWQVQNQDGFISPSAAEELATGLNLSFLDVQETLSFYHFFHDRPSGEHKIYLADTVIARMNGYEAVREALEEVVGCQFGAVSADGRFGLFDTHCIGLSDQEPAMLVDGVPFTNLDPEKVRSVITALQNGTTAQALANPQQLPDDTIEYIEALAGSQIHQSGPIFFQDDFDIKAVVTDILAKRPEEVVYSTSASKLRGRGGAGFSAGLKWQLCRDAPGKEKYLICNADEGEPGTYKDRVILTKSPEQVLAGMIVAAYAIGAKEGILYLRSEYTYLVPYLEKKLSVLRSQNLLGDQIQGRTDFSFDIRIQLGAGAYICGDESALIESCEGKRGTPRVKPPFPVQQGYLGQPTAVNNVETFATVASIMQKGAKWYEAMGTNSSAGTRLISVAGDVEKPGIYEIEWGSTLSDVLLLVGAQNARAVQVSGPSGECVSVSKGAQRTFDYNDLSCNGSMMVFNHQRDLLTIVREFIHFFVEESCGICVPCRAGNVALYDKLNLVIAGHAVEEDLDEIIAWSNIIHSTSRCGLGTTSPKPILTTLNQFPEIYQEKLTQQQGPLLASFDLNEAMEGYAVASDILMPKTRKGTVEAPEAVK
ncbi:NAD(P)H-dependent oxidoreductase subunit E [Vibrio penaeicida]|uniref:NAD(P)H-dependent oxidoreductase subunit E n=1 Tax=Vibrio penaeicida TaxID=104609 RepID=UPI000CEA43D1|nr:NAD(P)H-dependent oxidoreductase subunit E [Vibrio penaeicida]